MKQMLLTMFLGSLAFGQDVPASGKFYGQWGRLPLVKSNSLEPLTAPQALRIKRDFLGPDLRKKYAPVVYNLNGRVRYYRLGNGEVKERVIHALASPFRWQPPEPLEFEVWQYYPIAFDRPQEGRLPPQDSGTTRLAHKLATEELRRLKWEFLPDIYNAFVPERLKKRFGRK